MKLSPAPLLFGFVFLFALAACSSGENDDTATNQATANEITSDEDASSDGSVSNNSVVVEGPNGFTLVLEEFGEIANWSYTSSTVNTLLCGELQVDRTLRIYRVSIAGNADVSCEGGGGSIVALEAGREIEQPDQDGVILVTGGDIGTVVSGGASFGKSDVGTVVVEIVNQDEPAILPATLSLQMSANSGQVTFTFSSPPTG